MRKLHSIRLGFSREHRRLNVRRHGHVGDEIARQGGNAFCTLIAPHFADSAEMRQMVTRRGTPLLVDAVAESG